MEPLLALVDKFRDPVVGPIISVVFLFFVLIGCLYLLAHQLKKEEQKSERRIQAEADEFWSKEEPPARTALRILKGGKS